MSRWLSPVTAAAMAAVVATTLFALWAGNMQFEAAAQGCSRPMCGTMAVAHPSASQWFAWSALR